MVTLQKRTEDVKNRLTDHHRHDATFGLVQDEPELEVFDNWEGQPGAAVMAGGEVQHQRKQVSNQYMKLPNASSSMPGKLKANVLPCCFTVFIANKPA